MVDQIKISGTPEKDSIGEGDYLVGNVGATTNATGRVTLAALRTRLNTFLQTIIGNVTVSGSHQAASYQGNGALLTSVPSAGVGGTSSETSLTLQCNSANGTPAAKIVGSKFSQDLFEADENGFSLKTGIPYTHADDVIPFNKSLDLQDNITVRDRNALNSQVGPSAVFTGEVGQNFVSADDVTFRDWFENGGHVRFWIKPDLNISGTARIYQKGVNRIILNGAGSGFAKLRLVADFSGDDGDWTMSESNLVLGQWNCVEWVYNASSLSNDPKCFIGGVEQLIEETAAPTGTYVSDIGSDLYIGNRSAGDTPFMGEMGLFEFGNVEDSDEEAKAKSSNQLVAIGFSVEGASNAEKNTQADATSDNGGTEANSVGNWVKGGSLDVLQSQSGTVAAGSYALEANANAVPSTNCTARINMSTYYGLEQGKRYKLKAKVAHVGTGGDWIFGLNGSSIVSALDILLLTLTSSDTAFEQVEYDFTFNEDIQFLSAKELNASNDGGVYIDDISIIQLGVTAHYPGSNLVIGADKAVEYWKDNSGNGNHAVGTDVVGANISDQMTEVSGTATLSVAGGTGDPGTYTLTGGTAKWKKVGTLVTLYDIVITDITQSVAGSGALRILGLPFEASGEAFGSVRVGSINYSSGASLALKTADGLSTLLIVESGSGVGFSSTLITDIISGAADIGGSITYPTND